MITTTYKGPTDHRGSRIIARGHRWRVTTPWDYAIGVEENHKKAAEVFARKHLESDAGGGLRMGGHICCAGQLPTGERVFVTRNALRRMVDEMETDDLARDIARGAIVAEGGAQ
jgi:hypothetical protein